MPNLKVEHIAGIAINGTVDLVESNPTLNPSPINTTPTGNLCHVRCDQDFQFDFNWNQLGWIGCILCGNYKIEVCFEQWCAGEFSPTPNSVLVPTSHGTNVAYSASLNFLANSVPAGVYGIVACITLLDPMGNPQPVAGFVDLGKVKFYDYKKC